MSFTFSFRCCVLD